MINLHEIPAYTALTAWANGALKFTATKPEHQQAVEVINALVAAKGKEILDKYTKDILTGRPVILDENGDRVANEDFFNWEATND